MNDQRVCFRDRTLEFFDSEFTLTQRFGGELGDHIVWDAAMVLLAHLETFPREFWRGKHVLELGSGCGAVGIGLSKCSQTMWICLTDQAPLVELMQKNIDQNADSVMQINFLKARALQWPVDSYLDGPSSTAPVRSNDNSSADTNPADNLRCIRWQDFEREVRSEEYGPFDIVLMSDCVYPDRSEWLLLRNAMLVLGRINPKTLFIMSHELRGPIDRQFFVEIQRDFVLERIPPAKLPEQYRSEDVAVFHLQIRPSSVA
jgi:predicted nicotinamide N-methyase